MLPKCPSRPLPFALALVLSIPAALAQSSDPAPGQWGQKAPLIEPNSEFTLASTGGKIYVLGGYPAGRVSVKTVQVYDIASDQWSRGPDLPEVNNHGIAAAHDGVIYLFGGQTDPNTAYVDTVYALDTKQGESAAWVRKASMPTKRSAGAAVVYENRTYVVGGARHVATTLPSTIRRRIRGKRCRICQVSATTLRPS
jgi:N-acetylneuraminic acid mutarotase